jgi:hypothetical protein
MHLDSLYYSYEDKLKKYNLEKENVYRKLLSLKINTNTAYRLLKYIDEDKVKTKMYLIEYLAFYLKQFYKPATNINFILMRQNNIDCETYTTLYGLPFKRVKID